MTMKSLKFAGLLFLVFMCGVNVSNNLTILLDVDIGAYDAGWWKVGLATVLAVAFGAAAWKINIGRHYE